MSARKIAKNMAKNLLRKNPELHRSNLRVAYGF